MSHTAKTAILGPDFVESHFHLLVRENKLLSLVVLHGDFTRNFDPGIFFMSNHFMSHNGVLIVTSNIVKTDFPSNYTQHCKRMAHTLVIEVVLIMTNLDN